MGGWASMCVCMCVCVCTSMGRCVCACALVWEKGCVGGWVCVSAYQFLSGHFLISN